MYDLVVVRRGSAMVRLLVLKTRSGLIAAGALALTGVAVPCAAESELVRLTASDGESGDWFGFSVAIDDDVMLVGAPSAASPLGVERGAAYVFRRVGDVWIEEAKLFADDGEAQDWFGWSVAIEGDTALVGAPGALSQTSAPPRSAAYVFLRNDGEWSQLTKLDTPDNGLNDNGFGAAIALDGETAIITAVYDDGDGALNSQEGAAFVFRRDAGDWAQTARLVSPGTERFGMAAAIDGGTVIVGGVAPPVGQQVAEGAAWVFAEDDGAWLLDGELHSPNPTMWDMFGAAVAVEGGVAVVGAYGQDGPDWAAQGGAYVFERSGEAWSLAKSLVSPNAASLAWFGISTAIENERIVVGSIDNEFPAYPDRGAAYLFTRSGDWAIDREFAAEQPSASAHLGYSVAISGRHVVAGAFGAQLGGAAYVFQLPCVGDLNDDGAIDGADLGLLLGSWGGVQGDLTGDGVTDGADLGLLLGAWGACP
jgi:hypothetical protein